MAGTAPPISKKVDITSSEFFISRSFISLQLAQLQCGDNACCKGWDDSSWLKIMSMRKFFSTYLAIKLACLLSGSAIAESFEFPSVHFHDLPNALQQAYKHEKPNLGEIGRCVVSFDSNMVEEKMIFTCSIYVKMSAVAERKAMDRCEAMRAAKGLKNPCRVVHE
jgi:hypothetical protein